MSIILLGNIPLHNNNDSDILTDIIMKTTILSFPKHFLQYFKLKKKNIKHHFHEFLYMVLLTKKKLMSSVYYFVN